MKGKEQVNILFVIGQLDAGGSERVVLDLASNLNKAKYSVYVAAFKGGSIESSLQMFCKEIFLIEKKRRFDLPVMVQLAKIIQQYRIDIVNAHHIVPCFYSFLGAKVVNSSNLIYTEHSVPEVEVIASNIRGKILYWMFFKMDKVIGVSNEITEAFKSFYPKHSGKFLTILNGVDIQRFVGWKNRDDMRRQWGFSKDHFVVGTVANFRRVKNHVCMIRAAARLIGNYSNIRLFFVGTGFPGDIENSEGEVRDLVKNLGLQDKVVFAGYQENIPIILKSLDVFCLPSLSEGLPVSILEAMAAGIPVVGSNVRGIKEVVQDRDTGLLFASDDEIDLAKRIEELLISSDFKSDMARRAFNYVKKNHSKRVWVEQVSEVFLNPSGS